MNVAFGGIVETDKIPRPQLPLEEDVDAGEQIGERVLHRQGDGQTTNTEGSQDRGDTDALGLQQHQGPKDEHQGPQKIGSDGGLTNVAQTFGVEIDPRRGRPGGSDGHGDNEHPLEHPMNHHLGLGRQRGLGSGNGYTEENGPDPSQTADGGNDDVITLPSAGASPDL